MRPAAEAGLTPSIEAATAYMKPLIEAGRPSVWLQLERIESIPGSRARLLEGSCWDNGTEMRFRCI